MQPNVKPNLRGVTLSLLALLLTACSSVSQPLSPQPVEPARIPPLPQAARQPNPPPICSLSCNAGLTKLREELARSLTSPDAPASSSKEELR